MENPTLLLNKTTVHRMHEPQPIAQVEQVAPINDEPIAQNDEPKTSKCCILTSVFVWGIVFGFVVTQICKHLCTLN